MSIEISIANLNLGRRNVHVVVRYDSCQSDRSFLINRNAPPLHVQVALSHSSFLRLFTFYELHDGTKKKADGLWLEFAAKMDGPRIQKSFL